MATSTGYQNGLGCKLYYDASGVGGSSWSEIEIVGDLTIDNSHNAGTVKNRASGYELELPGQKVLAVSGTLHLKRGDTDYNAIRAAYINKTAIGIAAMTGTITDINEEGPQFDAFVKDFAMSQSLEDPVSVDVTFTPHANYGTAPSYAVISA